MGIKLIIFDLDGTLYKSEFTFVSAVQNALRDFGMPILEREKILPLLRFTAQGYAEELLLNSKDKDGIDVLRKKIKEYELAAIPVAGVLYPGVKETLKELRANGYDMAICTNAGYDYLNAVMKETGIKRYFPLAFGNDSGKPKSDLAADLINAAGLGPEACILVGDSDSDQHAAEKNGVLFIEAAWGYGNESIVNPDYNIPNIKKLPDLLKGVIESALLP